MTEPQPTVDVDAHVQRVAALLPFPVELDADMGGTFALQIDLGQRGGVDDPHDTAGIDPDSPRWWIDIEGGEHTYLSNLGLDADPAAVAAWSAHTATEAGCPAAVDAGMRRRNAIVAANNPPHLDRLGIGSRKDGTPVSPVTPDAGRER